MAYMAETAKAKQTLNISYSQAIDVVKAVIQQQGITFKGAVIKEDNTIATGAYGERTLKIYIYKINDNQCDISVRAGTSDAGKQYAQEILQAIVDYAESES